MPNLRDTTYFIVALVLAALLIRYCVADETPRRNTAPPPALHTDTACPETCAVKKKPPAPNPPALPRLMPPRPSPKPRYTMGSGCTLLPLKAGVMEFERVFTAQPSGFSPCYRIRGLRRFYVEPLGGCVTIKWRTAGRSAFLRRHCPGEDPSPSGPDVRLQMRAAHTTAAAVRIVVRCKYAAARRCGDY